MDSMHTSQTLCGSVQRNAALLSSQQTHQLGQCLPSRPPAHLARRPGGTNVLQFHGYQKPNPQAAVLRCCAYLHKVAFSVHKHRAVALQVLQVSAAPTADGQPAHVLQLLVESARCRTARSHTTTQHIMTSAVNTASLHEVPASRH